jgi:3-hydroxyisobutyrate dehydrogenase-like beta-hydroxyacid dehydrogenase
MKMSINLLLGTMVAGLGEAMAFGERAGLDPGSVLDVVMAGPLASGLFGYKEELLRSGTYPVAFPAKHMAKDFKYIIDTAYETGARTPVAHEMLQLYRAAVDRGLGDEDFAAVAELFK